MSIFVTIKVALKSLMRHKMRTFLTALGIIIGVGAVVALLAVTQGARTRILSIIQSMGNNLIQVVAASKTRGGIKGGWGSITTLKPADAKAIQENCRYIKYASPLVSVNARMVYKNRNWESVIDGGNEHIFYINAWNISRGSPFAVGDVNSANKVCVLGQRIVDNLFDPDEDPIGVIIRINKIPFKVVGMLESKGASGSEFLDDKAFIPYTTMMQRMYKKDYIQVIIASAVTRDDTEKAKEDISQILRQRHRLMQEEDDDFVIFTQDEILSMVDEFSKTLSMLLGAVASVSLLVGGIGIMNIMLVSVNERIREIGIRMAMGARQRDILRQFLIEAMTLSVAGGIIGVGFGYVIANLIKSFTQWSITITWWSIVLAISFACAVGIFFGFYPAWKASKLDPIVALRHE